MKSFTGSFGSEWIWKRPQMWRRQYELRTGGELIARLESRSLPGGSMWAETASGSWRVRHVGLLRGRSRVTAEGATEPAVEFRPRWFGAGDIETARGNRFRWHRADFWGQRWAMVDSGGLRYLAFARSPAFLSLDTRVDVADHARDDAELEPLVLLGYYLLLLMVRQSHAAL